MKKLREFLEEKTGRVISWIFGYEIGKYIDYAYVDDDGILRSDSYLYD